MLYYSIMKQQQKLMNINKGVLPMYSKYMYELKKNSGKYESSVMITLSSYFKHQLNRLNKKALGILACELVSDKNRQEYLNCFVEENMIIKVKNKKTLIDFITKQIIKE